ncbi:hypothetical protein K438DRAFT_1845649 [Mycena galopus ATCC 62051]|nr:hypothetical protein K438DRAFT_1845649 [Mycena galopus ATCC 62051]
MANMSWSISRARSLRLSALILMKIGPAYVPPGLVTSPETGKTMVVAGFAWFAMALVIASWIAASPSLVLIVCPPLMRMA